MCESANDWLSKAENERKKRDHTSLLVVKFECGSASLHIWESTRRAEDVTRVPAVCADRLPSRLRLHEVINVERERALRVLSSVERISEAAHAAAADLCKVINVHLQR